jgi:hypothetical protein
MTNENYTRRRPRRKAIPPSTMTTAKGRNWGKKKKKKAHKGVYKPLSQK